MTKLSRLPATQIPDCLCNAAGDKPSVRQADLVEPFEDLLEPPILPERDFEIVQRFLSHGRQFTSSSIELFPTVVSATSKGGSDAHQGCRMRLRATYRELFGRSGPNLPLSLSRMSSANRIHLRDCRSSRAKTSL